MFYLYKGLYDHYPTQRPSGNTFLLFVVQKSPGALVEKLAHSFTNLPWYLP